MQISEKTQRFYPNTPAGEKMAGIYETQSRRLGTFKCRAEDTQRICIKTELIFELDEESNTVTKLVTYGKAMKESD